MNLDVHKELFDVALDTLQTIGDDLTNKALEITLESDPDDFIIRVYDLPKL